MRKTLNISAATLGFGSYLNQSSHVDWREAYGDDCEGWRVILPRPTLGDISEHAEELLSPAQIKSAAGAGYYRAAPEALAEEFTQEGGGDEWAQGFEPMMNCVWPVLKPYQMDETDLADRLARFAPACTLIYFGEFSEHCTEDYGFALNGGGMNLSDHIAAAYLCAEQIPPVRILDGLAGVIGESMLARIGPTLKRAYVKAAEGLDSQARRVREERARVFKPKAKPKA